MRIVLATGNRGKVREITAMFEGFDVVPYTELIAPFEIVEDGDDFKSNALIKARAVYEALADEDAIVMADDSGISVDALGGEPGVYSARYAGAEATDRDNVSKLVGALRAKGVERSPAYYTAAIALVWHGHEYTMHGWMHGTAITEPRGDKGFGYDPMFIPEGYDQTLGELDEAVKSAFSHRSRALALARVVLEAIRAERG